MSAFTPERSRSPWIYFFDEHRLAAGLGWQRLFRQPYQTLGAISLMTISLSLLIIFSLLFHKAVTWKASLNLLPQAMVFSKSSLTPVQVRGLYSDLSATPTFSHCQQHNAQDVLTDFLTIEEMNVFSESLPPIFTIDYPITTTLKEMIDLKSALERNPLIDRVDVDMIGHAKMMQLISFAKVVMTLLGAVLLSCVVITIHYSIKLFMDRYQQEIAILYHLGASSDFIQRPYIYQGLFLGILGAFSAILALTGLYYFLDPQMQSLLELYESSWAITSEEYQIMGVTLCSVVLFAIGSAILATRKWLSLFEHERLG